MMDFILASKSEPRIKLLKQINYIPKKIVPANIDETPFKKEKAEIYVKRMAITKAETVALEYKNENVLAADSIVVVKNQIIQKPKNIEEIKYFLNLYSNKNIKSLTAVCLIKKNTEKIIKLVETKIKFKSLNNKDIQDCIEFSKNLNCAGGICIEGFSECLIKKINGSYSNVVGLPLYETRNILISSNIIQI